MVMAFCRSWVVWMSSTNIPENAFVPREDEASLLARAMAFVRKTEGERRWTTTLAMSSGWLAAMCMGGALAYSMTIIKNRPVPQDRPFISFINSDGVPQPARSNLTQQEALLVMQSFMRDYLRHRINYTWETVQGNYDWVRMVTFGDEQKAYTDMMQGPTGPFKTYAEGGTRTITWMGTPEQTGQFVFLVPFKYQTKDKQGIVSPEISEVATVTFNRLNSLPIAIASDHDPLKIVVTRFQVDSASHL